MQNQDDIHIIATGGTIDKVYSPSKQTNVFKSKSGLPDFFKDRIGYDVSAHFTQLMMIDSLDIKEADRQTLLNKINDIKEKRIMVTHGTDTMIETAQFIEKGLNDKNKTIILMGSMVPMDGFYYSDAGFNLGYGISCAQLLNAGIYICMNGKVFTPDEVQKNIEQSKFESKDAA